MEHYPSEFDRNRSFSHSPKQVLLFLGVLIFLGMMFGSVLTALICKLQGLDFQEIVKNFGEDSSLGRRNFMRGSLLINHLFSFLVPALVAAWFFYKNKWASQLGIRHRPVGYQLGLGIMLIVFSFPLAQQAVAANSWIVERIGWLDAFVQTESMNENLIQGFLIMQSPFEFLFSLLIMAVVPAIGEEMVFRGLIQKHIEPLVRSPYFAILIAALLFSLGHFQVQRFLAIFLLGCILGLVYYWTKNLWIPIAGHFVFNGSQVLVAYFNQEELHNLNTDPNVEIPIVLTIFSMAAVFLIAKQLKPQE